MLLVLRIGCSLSFEIPSDYTPPQQYNSPNNRGAKWVGINYVPSSLSNNIEWFLHYDEVIDEMHFELSAAQHYLGFNTIRQFLHPAVYEADKKTVLRVMDDFMSIAAKYGMQVGWVFFDDAPRTQTLNLSEPCLPIKGVHNYCNTMAPVWTERNSMERYKPYVLDLIGPFVNDKRVAFWEIFNEPIGPRGSKVEFNPFDTSPTFKYSMWSFPIRKEARAWIDTLLKPSQPVLSCCGVNSETDLVDSHFYIDVWMWRQAWAPESAKRGVVLTEAGARHYGGREEVWASPMRVMALVKYLRVLGSVVPGLFPAWELMVGNTNTRWAWSTHDGAAEPVEPFHGHLFPDGTPVSFTEAAEIYKWITGVERRIVHEMYNDPVGLNALFEEGYLHLGGDNASDFRCKGTPCPTRHPISAFDLGDFFLEAAIMPRSASTPRNTNLRSTPFSLGTPWLASLSIVFHQSTAGHYQLTFTSVNGTQGLELFRVKYTEPGEEAGAVAESVGKYNVTELLECGVQPESFNYFRIAVRGPLVQVWLNTIWPDIVSGPYRQHTKRRSLPRIEYTDPDPLPQGKTALVVDQGYTLVQYISVFHSSILSWLDAAWATGQPRPVPTDGAPSGAAAEQE